MSCTESSDQPRLRVERMAFALTLTAAPASHNIEPGRRGLSLLGAVAFVIVGGAGVTLILLALLGVDRLF